jgi:ribosomal protein S18 acetylase RimI-like enzyme
MILTFAAEGADRGGMREVDPGRDLGVVAELIAEGFAGDLDGRAQAALREMRRTARMWPFIGWLAEADPLLRESLSGFVWEEPVPGKRGLQVVANVSLNPVAGMRRWSVICNVVTRPEYRRKGIARRLTMAAIDEARERGAEGVLLQVYAANLAARQLYADLGFRQVAGEMDLRLDKAARPPLAEAPDYTIRPLRPYDGRAAYELAQRETPEALQWLVPLHQGEFRPGVLSVAEQWLSDLLAGRRVYRLLALQGERLAALLTLRADRRGPVHSLSLISDAEDRGKIEAALVSQALRLLAGWPPAPVLATVNQDHKGTIEVLQGLGFKDQRTLLVMRKNLR